MLHRSRGLCRCVWLAFLAAAPLLSAGLWPGMARADDDTSFTLENIFPERSLFGPSASGMSFAPDGRHAAYLYRTNAERRHGSDLWIIDTETGTPRRVTSVSVLAEFQERAREVGADRIEYAKKKQKQQGADTGADAAGSPAAGPGGMWAGTMRSKAGAAAPTRLAFTFELKADGDDWSGRFKALLIAATVRDVTFDAERGRLRCTLVRNDGVTMGRLEANVDGDALEGTVRLEGMSGTLEITAKREGGSDTSAAGDDNGNHDNQDDGKGATDERDRVLDDDADRKDAPRYGGVGAFVWSPTAPELIFVAAGDLYLYKVEDDTITRLTRTRERESDVQFLPDGSGYTYLRDGALMRVAFGEHRIDQIDPALPNGETMLSYRLSPDGTRLAFLSGKGDRSWGAGGESVAIVNYRNRFAQVRQFPRHMSDNKLPDFEWGVYLYELGGHLQERGTLEKVSTHKRSGPRDIIDVPRWSPDSSRAAFAVFEQSSGKLEIREARLEVADDADEDADEARDEAKNEAKDEAKDEDEDGDDDADAGEGDDGEDDEARVTIKPARVVYRLLHEGGPNTPGMVDPHYAADSRRLVFLTETTGFRQLHVLDPLYENLEPLTSGRFEVYPIAISEDHRRIFARATKEDPAQEQVYAISIDDGTMERLSPEPGVYSGVAVSDDGRRVLARYVTYGTLPELVSIDVEAGAQTALTASHSEKAHALTERKPEFFTFENRHGHTIHGHMFKPDDWNEDDERPLLIYVYGGPLGTRKMVFDGSYAADAYFFAQYMAREHGYVTCTIDPRGASGYGGLFEKSNFEQVGKPQVEDLVDAARWMVKHHGVDEERMALHGWSFGGFQTQMVLYTEPDVFACGIAGAGPTEWENYNSWYSTGTIGKSRAGKTDLKAYSLLPLAKNLKSRLLLVHGMEDSNVLYQDTVRVYRELLKAGKETLVELFVDPTGGHGLGGDVKRIGRMRKYEAFLVDVLGTEKAEEDGE